MRDRNGVEVGRREEREVVSLSHGLFCCPKLWHAPPHSCRDVWRQGSARNASISLISSFTSSLSLPSSQSSSPCSCCCLYPTLDPTPSAPHSIYASAPVACVLPHTRRLLSPLPLLVLLFLLLLLLSLQPRSVPGSAPFLQQQGRGSGAAFTLCKIHKHHPSLGYKFTSLIWL